MVALPDASPPSSEPSPPSPHFMNLPSLKMIFTRLPKLLKTLPPHLLNLFPLTQVFIDPSKLPKIHPSCLLISLFLIPTLLRLYEKLR
ncbi:hypothetical protein AMTR_s00060p00162840 [Amborella trichopoda]|uniref:Uncharacterized protein n=1 Tax=Amborella trichopoda TaxID=13333 RepID=W1NJE7_AMBTC|nr:hypothetical protein AMTR_s00060p00162840 [Amborella trichopoda]